MRPSLRPQKPPFQLKPETKMAQPFKTEISQPISKNKFTVLAEMPKISAAASTSTSKGIQPFKTSSVKEEFQTKDSYKMIAPTSYSAAVNPSTPQKAEILSQISQAPIPKWEFCPERLMPIMALDKQYENFKGYY